MEKSSKNQKKTSAKSLKKTPAKKASKTTDAGKTKPKSKAAPERKVASGKTRTPQNHPAAAPTEAESQQKYYEGLGSRLAERAYELFVQRGYEHGHDLEDWLEAERQILPKEILERS
ncbi:MAG: DUF2934 domain-containing protein [Nitrospirota bacterium]|nr:DUF2934 domain-containing protein [Nitrospirota bacterium]